MINEVQTVGAPAVLIFFQPDDAQVIIQEIQQTLVDSTKYVLLVPEELYYPPSLGTVMIGYSLLNNTQYFKLIDLWKTLDPQVYVDNDGNRNALSYDSSAMIDSVFVLALALQASGNDTATGKLFRSKVFHNMLNITMYGTSGKLAFSPNGNRLNPEQSLSNFNGTHLNHIGFFSNGTFSSYDVTYVWPDGSTGYNNPSYSQQYKPYCNPGYNPIMDEDGIWKCLKCIHGFYKPYAGVDKCLSCPEGMLSALVCALSSISTSVFLTNSP